MSNVPPPAMSPFAGAARQVQQRLILRRSLQGLLKTWPYAVAVLASLAAFRILGALFATGGLAVGLLVLWVLGCIGFAWWTKPGAFAALSYWDRQASRGDAFASAWWFEAQPGRTAGQQLHLETASSKLSAALPGLSRDITLPDVRWLGLLPLLAVGLWLLPGGGGLRLPDPALTAEGRALAEKHGKEIAEKKLDAEKMQSLDEKERKELEKLQQKVQETAKALQEGGAKTSREVLSELEKRARDAEKLAAKLGAGDDAWASEQMVAEMRKHADTAELGDAVASKSAESTGSHAQKLADKLKDPKLTNETRDRFADTLREVGKQAQPEDKDRTVGQHVMGADKNMVQALPKEASKEFQALADKMKTLAAREKAREQLEKLAQQLRQSGSDIAGQGTKGMQQLAGSQGQQGQGQQQGGQSQKMQAMQNAPQMQPMQMPSFSNAPQGQQGAGQQMNMMTPVPGTGQQGKPMQLAPAQGKPGGGKGNQPMLFAPVPGMPPGQQGNIAMLGMGPGMGQGGLPPGNGTTAMGNTPTEKTKPGQAATVNAQRNADGASSVRTVEGQAHNETATRTAQTTAIEAIAAEENALDDQALPPARRDQVRRYFTELRKRFESQP